MRIAVTADPEISVPPVQYGGIERIVDMLVRSLVERGHEVALFAHPASTAPCPLVPWTGASSRSRADTIRNAVTLAKRIIGGRYDVVHSFSRIAYMLPILPLPIPKLMTYQRDINRRSIELGHRLSRGTLQFSAVSRWMTQGVKDIGGWHHVPNGVPLATYDFKPFVAPDAPLVFLGRVEEIKGPHLAIDIAKRTGSKLVIAGNIPVDKQAWFDTHVAKHIDDDQIRYIGPVDDAQKNALLGAARALLMPILWDEPFGIVMIEAMACGTAVLGLRCGAVPEVVEDGATGFVRDTLDELVSCVGRIDAIDRGACRTRVERFYSAEAVVDGYLDIYQSLIKASNVSA
jgi:glycosyltransferase involved in cell wall biosynthesis